MKDQDETFGIFGEALEEVENYEFIYEDFIQKFSDQVNDLMESQNVTKTQLAEKMNVSKSYISKILGANTNISLKTIAKITDALNAQFSFRVDHIEREVKWFSLLPSVRQKSIRQQFRNFLTDNDYTEEGMEYASTGT
ncbi:MAG: helix-turn-helix domain-containing protein [Desulfovermiculus sp.]|nr:helix-turn-helix domain-containing protein [Desulfovermiculus sp.]